MRQKYNRFLVRQSTSIRGSVCPSDRQFVDLLWLFIFGGIQVLRCTAWPVLALVRCYKAPLSVSVYPSVRRPISRSVCFDYYRGVLEHLLFQKTHCYINKYQNFLYGYPLLIIPQFPRSYLQVQFICNHPNMR